MLLHILFVLKVKLGTFLPIHLVHFDLISNIFLCRYASSDSVTRVNDSTRVTSFGDSDSTRVTLKKIVTRLDSSHSQWLETRVRVIFTKSLSSWWTNPVRLHTKKWGFFASVMIKIGENFLFWLSSCAMLHFKDQVSPTCVEADLRLLSLRGP